MAEQLADLIKKIQDEGVKAAQDKAHAIEQEALNRAKAIIDEAQKEAQTLMLQAQDKIAKMERSSTISLQQVGRDLLLSLKTEINSLLGQVVSARLRESLSAQELFHILTLLIKEYCAQGEDDIVVLLKKEDAQKLEQSFLGELKKKIKRGIILRGSDDVHGGVLISYDEGKSFFDFSDKALAEYIVTFLKPSLDKILRVESKKKNNNG